MSSTISILTSVKNRYSQFIFEPSDEYCWSFTNKTIYFDNSRKEQPILLLHELSHALLGHQNYSSDIELINMERQAWDKAVKIAPEFNLVIDEDFIENSLDSYRDWLHSRSICPECNATGMQINKAVYQCPACTNKWRVNQAKNCALRRYDSK